MDDLFAKMFISVSICYKTFADIFILYYIYIYIHIISYIFLVSSNIESANGIEKYSLRVIRITAILVLQYSCGELERTHIMFLVLTH